MRQANPQCDSSRAPIKAGFRRVHGIAGRQLQPVPLPYRHHLTGNSADMIVPAAGMFLPGAGSAVRARLFRFLLAPMCGAVPAGTLFTWRCLVS